MSKSRNLTPDLDCARFRASLPPIMSAIKIYGDDSGMRIQLEIPKSEMAEAVKVVGMGGVVLEVTVRVVESLTEFDDGSKKVSEDGSPRMDRRRSANR